MEKKSMKKYFIKEGNYKNQGITSYNKGYQITIAAKNVESLSLVIYEKNTKNIENELELPISYRKGDLYSYYIEGIELKNRVYHFRINEKLELDAYAKAIVGRETWAEKRVKEDVACQYLEENYQWEGDCSLKHPSHQLIIYKVHPRGFTRHKSSKVRHKGTFAGITEKIPYLKELGITAIELMPSYEFEENLEKSYNYRPSYAVDGIEEDVVLNYWGYGKGNYFAPKYSYAAGKNPRKEFKDMVKELHKNGIELIMEFYFEDYTNQNLIVDCVKYWVEEYHIDGVHLYGNQLPIVLLAQEPLLSDIKILQNYQDTKMVYKPEENIEYRNLYEYNDGFQGCGRRLLKGDGGQISEFAYRIRKNEEQQAVVNFMANHNGFTLYDSVCYEKKHNEDNGEGGKDGSNFNYTWNCGIEGNTRKKKILELRKKQLKNALTFVLLSQGVPLLSAGDERCNTQYGNNNPYCQDNEISWVLWQENSFQKEILQFAKELIAFRKKHPILSGTTRLRVMDYLACGYPDISYHGEKAWTPYFDQDSRYMGIMYCGNYACIDKVECDDFIYVAYNLHWEKHVMALPNLPKGKKWVQLADTSKPSGQDWLTEEVVLENQMGVEVMPRSIAILRGRDVKAGKRKQQTRKKSRGEINEHLGTF